MGRLRVQEQRCAGNGAGKPRQETGALVKFDHAAGWGPGGHNLLCALHKPEFPTREDVSEEQETLNLIKRGK